MQKKKKKKNWGGMGVLYGEGEGFEADPELARAQASREGHVQRTQEVEEAQEQHQRAWYGMPVKVAHPRSPQPAPTNTHFFSTGPSWRLVFSSSAHPPLGSPITLLAGQAHSGVK